MITNLTYHEKVCFFFGSTPMSHPPGNFHSTLRLILNDIEECGAPGSNRLAFPRAMCLMVAVDLLAKMYAGSAAINRAGARFIDVTENLLLKHHSGIDVGERIWAFRNALHHSYRLPAEWRPKGSTMPVKRRFMLVDETSEPRLTWDTLPDLSWINLACLHKDIGNGITTFHIDVAARTGTADQVNFTSMFDEYGWLYVS